MKPKTGNEEKIMDASPTDATVLPFRTAKRRTDPGGAQEAASPPLPVSRIDPLAQLFEAPQPPAERRRPAVPEPAAPDRSSKSRKPRPKRVDPVIHQAVDAALEHLGRLDSETMTGTEQALAAALRSLCVAVMHQAAGGNV